jgi:hypothetical protein
MGDGISNTPWDVFMYFLLFGGVPFFAVVLPLLVAPLVYRVTRRLLVGRSKNHPSLEGFDDE